MICDKCESNKLEFLGIISENGKSIKLYKCEDCRKQVRDNA